MRERLGRSKAQMPDCCASDRLIYRREGRLSLADPTDAAPAEEAFLAAIAVAQQQKGRSFELRDSMILARLWRSQGKPQQARELLSPVYGWFTEGFDTLDLKEAKALLYDLHD
jgi:predicted ATPase